MKTKYLLFGVAILAFVMVVFLVLGDSDSQKRYVEQVEKDRKNREEIFKNSPESPIAKKDSFAGLKYFPVNPDFRLKAKFEKIKGNPRYALQMTQSDAEQYVKFGYARFSYQNKNYQVLLLHKPGDKYLFFPFTDASNGKTTYEAGRYINNVPFPKTEEIILDFNYATNPYCVYNAEYTCPIPPKENRLAFAIEAGEKKYK
ncbi:MAG: DUF1684 domain-containing protein [Thermonemataceae bacterium]|nr:DUF1684 domain-containing protein [Thermonemataceae bacterium]